MTKKCIMILLLICVSQAAAGRGEQKYGPVHFADPNLELAVELKLGISDPNRNDMLNLTKLTAYGKGIIDITGIGYAVNLTYLDLHDNQLTSISSEVGNLTKLQHLFLYSNQLTSLPSEIKNLKRLHRLYLYNNPLSTDFYCISYSCQIFNCFILNS